MQADAPKSAPGPGPAIPPVGAWLWSREAGCFVSVTPAYFELHPIAESDPRFHALSRGERVAVAATAFLLWMPAYVPAERIHHRGTVAVALNAAMHDSAPELSLDGKPYVFLRVGAPDPAWLLAHLGGRGVWFSYDGSSLHALLGFDVDRDGLLVVDLERVVG